MHISCTFRHTAILSVFLPFPAQSQVFLPPEDPTAAYEQYAELQSDPLVVPDRYRLARMDQNELIRSVRDDTPIVLNLFNDVELRAQVQSTKDLANGSSFISGSLENGGHFTLFLHNSGIIRGRCTLYKAPIL